jgi:CRP-like cAMP-binding protein|tara:strand:- start:657 stop:1535 length:879 start_codon:yes stop_codon:yes gene_type:complete
MLAAIDKALFLRSVKIFSSVSESHLDHIATVSESVDYRKGDMIMAQGDFGSSMYIVVDGQVRVFQGSSELLILGSSAVFGEMAALDPEPRAASVQALEDCTLLRLEGEALHAMMAESPELTRAIIKVLCDYARTNSELAQLLEQQLLDRQEALLVSIEKDKARGRQSVFISHASENKEYVEQKIIPALDRAGVGYWFSTVDIQSASIWERSILAGLQQCEWFLIAMSPESLQSEWVKDELFWAIDNRPQHIIPVLTGSCDPVDFHIRMRRLQLIDFTAGIRDAQEKIRAVLT